MWARVQTPGGSGFVRTDYLSIAGDGSDFGLSEGDEYAAPMSSYWWVRGFNLKQNPNEEDHLGWDFGANVGEPVRCGPMGGRVVRMFNCTRCTAEKPSTISQGIPLGASSVFLDPAWGFGYGNALIIRYLNSQLPESTRQRLAARGLSGAHLYAIYAHLSAIQVSEGLDLPPNTVIGTCGNTGNSTASHLHLEIRASFNASDPNWTGMRPNLMDPGVLYLR
ncbi:MAG: M23 family metallopeptidase [Chloroflexi bacterium]|nr:M23 family metallopeptidase [Chloroflexota bacterium]